MHLLSLRQTPELSTAPLNLKLNKMNEYVFTRLKPPNVKLTVFSSLVMFGRMPLKKKKKTQQQHTHTYTHPQTYNTP